MYQLQPYGDEWEIADVLGRLIAASGELRPKLKPGDLIPYRENKQSEDEVAATMKSWMEGTPQNGR